MAERWTQKQLAASRVKRVEREQRPPAGKVWTPLVISHELARLDAAFIAEIAAAAKHDSAHFGGDLPREVVAGDPPADNGGEQASEEK